MPFARADYVAALDAVALAAAALAVDVGGIVRVG
jgi:hypothetical protein